MKRLRAGAVWLLALELAGLGASALQTAALRRPDASVPPEAARLDLNRATLRELACTRGVGPVLAGRIVARRARRGGVHPWAELRGIRGLGPAKTESLRRGCFLAGAENSSPADASAGRVDSEW